MPSFPMGTGAVCALVGINEHRARNLIRSGRLSVPCVGGRRMWFSEHVLKLAKLVGLDTVEVRNAIFAAEKASVPAPTIHTGTACYIRAVPPEDCIREVAHADNR